MTLSMLMQDEREQGIEQGIERGIEQAQEGFVVKMLTAGKLALKEIAEYSGLPLAQVEAIQRKMA